LWRNTFLSAPQQVISASCPPSSYLSLFHPSKQRQQLQLPTPLSPNALLLRLVPVSTFFVFLLLHHNSPMPRLNTNPNEGICPDYLADIFAAMRLPFVNDTTTDERAAQLLSDFWTAGNNADKTQWQTQLDDNAEAMAQLECEEADAQQAIATALALEKEASALVTIL
jgi:hypothetical protein